MGVYFVRFFFSLSPLFPPRLPPFTPPPLQKHNVTLTHTHPLYASGEETSREKGSSRSFLAQRKKKTAPLTSKHTPARATRALPGEMKIGQTPPPPRPSLLDSFTAASG